MDRSGSLLGKSLEFASRRLVDSRRSEVLRAQDRLSGQSDEALRAAARQALAGRSKVTRRPGELRLGERMIEALAGLVVHRRQAGHGVANLALGIECFARAPADLADGCALYPEQISAARALTQRSLVQMETGEGKTYALLPAAFVLACAYHRVYILCASDYLAWRDANRTGRFWEFVGLAPGLAVEGGADEEWSRRVVYTTLERLMFKILQDGSRSNRSANPLSFSALVLDEADAILLDQVDHRYALVKMVDAEAFDWDDALRRARQLDERDVVVDRFALEAALTPRAESELRRELRAAGQSGVQLLLNRHAVETAYIATRVVEKDVDYVIEGNCVSAINRISSKVERGVIHPWLAPLEHSLGLPPRPRSVTLDSATPILYLNEFAHLSGTSGTIMEDAVEYLLTYGLVSVRLPPRYPRLGRTELDQVFASKDQAREAVCRSALDAVAAGRPVLIGTQTVADAEAIHAGLAGRAAAGTRVELLTGKDDRSSAGIFERGGRVGSVIVATQLAGRGVDIRLTEEARRNGGMALICVGHAVDARHDRQFRGRVGRQGDPFSEVFICSMEDALFKEMGANRVQKVVETLSEPGEPTESRMVSRSISQAQDLLRRRTALRRRGAAHQSFAQAGVHAAMRAWFELLQLPGPEGRADGVSPDLVARAIDHYLEEKLSPRLESGGPLSRQASENLARWLAGSLCLEVEARTIRAVDLEGRAGGEVERKIREKLETATREAADRNARERAARRERERIRASLWQIHARCGELLQKLDPESWDEIEEDWKTSPRSPDEAAVERRAELQARLDELAKKMPAATDGDEEPPGKGDGERELFARLQELRREAEGGVRAFEPLPAHAGRGPREIARWTLQLGWMGFLEEVSRIRHRVAQEDRSAPQYHRIVSDRIRREWRRTEAGLSESLLTNLLRAGDLDALDDLFQLEDHSVWVTSNPRPRSAPLPWTPQAGADVADTPDIESLIELFVEQSRRLLPGRDVTEAGLRRLLMDFSSRYPPETLRNPSEIQQALEDWLQREAELSVRSSALKEHRRWLWRFLEALRGRGLVGALPRLRHRVRSRIAGLARSLVEIRSLATVLGGSVALALFALGIRFGAVLPSRSLDALGSYVDDLVFGGLVGAGNLLAPVMGPLAAGAVVTFLLNRPGTTALRGFGPDRVVVPLMQVGVAAWMAWAGTSGLGGSLRATALFVVMILLATVVRRVVWILDNTSSLDLLAVWLAYCGLAVAAPALAPPGLSPGAWVAVFGVVALSLALWPALNRIEVDLLSARLGAGPGLADSEEITTAVRIRGGEDVSPHIFALFSAWAAGFGATRLASAWRLPGAASEIALAVLYLLVTLVWIQIVLRRRLSPRLWALRLNQRRQILAAARDGESRPAKLAAYRRTLFWREAVAQSLLVGALAALLAGHKLPGTELPLALPVAATAAVVAANARRFTLQLYHFHFSRVPAATEALEAVAHAPSGSGEAGKLERVVKLMIAAGGAIVTIWELFERAMELFAWLRGLIFG